MTDIERTAYPHLKKGSYSKNDLQNFLPSEDELDYMHAHDIRTDKMRLSFIIQLKSFQCLGYFPKLDQVPNTIITTVRKVLCSPKLMKPGYQHTKSKYRHRNLIKKFLRINENNTSRDKLIIKVTNELAQTMNDPANIINSVLEELIKKRYELPTFSALDRIVCSVRHHINDDLFKKIRKRLGASKKVNILIKTLTEKDGDSKTAYNKFKNLPEKPTVMHFKELVEHHNWLTKFGDFSKCFTGISKIKLEQFSQEARSLDASEVKSMRNDNKKLSLIACLLVQAQCRTKDALAQTFSRCVHDPEKSAERYHKSIDHNKDKTVKSIAELFLTITTKFQEKYKNSQKVLIDLFNKHYKKYGGTQKVIEDCEKVLAKGKNKHLPFIWKYYQSKRTGIFSFLKSVNLKSIKQDKPLMQAIHIVEDNRLNNSNLEWVKLNKQVDLSFAPRDWLPLIAKKDKKTINTHYFELCVMRQLREKLSTSDVYIEGADAYGDYRKTLLPWEKCMPLLDKFCKEADIPNNAKEMVALFKDKLKTKAKEVDDTYPDLKELVISTSGKPTLKKRPTKKKGSQAKALLKEIKKRMPERSLLDIMSLTQSCTHWANGFSPLSGSDSKLSESIGANIVTTFGYATGMGSSETARHVRAGFSRKTIIRVNKKQVTVKKLDLAIAKIVDFYKEFPLIKAWGTGEAVIVDGTLRKIYTQNLLAEAHFRYKAKGSIAYHHVSDTYIALFSSLLPCGTWEAIAIIEGLLRNESSVKPTKVHGDTQSASSPVFAFAYFFGIYLMPRIRNWSDLTLYKSDNRVKYKNIDSLFSGSINWNLIENYWQDMMQIVISIKQGKISSDLILSKLNSRNRSSQLYMAFRELGNVIRTLFLLDFISDPDLREQINAETNKVESFNNLSGWVRFASDVIIASNDTEEMEKAIKYNTLLTNMLILQNVIDITRIIQKLKREGWSITIEDIASLSPYLTGHLNRFGDYLLDLTLRDGNINKLRAESLFT